jgi:hypothetical protein
MKSAPPPETMKLLKPFARSRRREPRLHGVAELVGRHPGMGERQDPQHAVEVLAGQELPEVAVEGGSHHRIRSERGLGGDAPRELVEGERRLERHRVLGPEGAVVVEDGDALGHRNEVG